jgi:hypothetical protein
MTATTTAAERPRLGLALKLWLGLVALAGLWAAYRYGMTIEDLVDHHDPRWTGDMVWALPALLGLSAGNALCAGLVLLRLRLGVWLILVDALASLAIVLVLGVPVATLLPGLGGLAVLLVLVYANRDAMR